MEITQNNLWQPNYGVLPALPPDWRIYALRLRLSGKWFCRVQKINHDVFIYAGDAETPELAVQFCVEKIEDFETKRREKEAAA